MAETFKILGQAALAATTLTDVYTVPAATSASISSVIVCNRGATATTFRISLAIAGAGDATAQYLYFDTPIEANDTFIATIGVTLATTDVLRAFAGNTSLSVNVVGVQIT